MRHKVIFQLIVHSSVVRCSRVMIYTCESNSAPFNERLNSRGQIPDYHRQTKDRNIKVYLTCTKARVYQQSFNASL